MVRVSFFSLADIKSMSFTSRVTKLLPSKVKARIPEEGAGRVAVALGAMCLITAIILVFLQQAHGDFETPLWIAAAIVAGLSAGSAIYNAFAIDRVNGFPTDEVSTDCARYMRNEAIVSTVIAGGLAVVLATVPKYKNFKITMAPEIILFIAAFVLSNGGALYG